MEMTMVEKLWPPPAKRDVMAADQAGEGFRQ